MFSGKTTCLMEALERLEQELKLPFILINHSLDNRYNAEKVTSHDGRQLPAKRTNMLSKLEKTIRDENFRIIGRFSGRTLGCSILTQLQLFLPSLLSNWSICLFQTGIDEGQFFDDITSFCEKMANENRIVLIAAILGDHELNGFKDILSLLPKVERIHMRNAKCDYCWCSDAAFWKPRSNQHPTTTINIGGKEKFVTLCRKCFFKVSWIKSLTQLLFQT